MMIMDKIFKNTTTVRLLTGKYKGFEAIPICYVDSHPLSSDIRVQVRVQTGVGWRTLLVNYNNLEVVR